MILTERFVILIVISALLIGFSGWFGPLMPLGVTLASLAVVMALGEWLRLMRVNIEVTRACDDKLSLGAENPIKLLIRNRTYFAIKGFVRDEYPEGFKAEGNIIPMNIAARSDWEAIYHVMPPKRGDYEFGDTYIRLHSPLGLVMRQMKFPPEKRSAKRQVKVYPNLLDMRRYEISLKRERATQPGQRLIRIRGRGTEFESLREYLPDDEFRAVDWKASAKRNKLVTRQYQEEKSQNVMIVLDCGRVMGPVIADLTRLDHSINSAMMLAHVAALKGDKVGMMAFGDDIITYSPPRAGKPQTLNLLRLAYNLEEAAGESNYYRAIPYLSKKWTRRSLVVFFTDIVDPESSKPLISQIMSLTRKHLCMCVTMTDPAVLAAARGKLEGVEDAFTTAAARQALQAKKRAMAQLAQAGAIVVDVPPDKFTPAIVDQYLDVKSRARL